MERIRSLIKKLAVWEPLPFLLLAAAAFIPLLFVSLYAGDDIYFTDTAARMGLFDFLVMRYHTWTSRVVIEFFLYFFTNHGLLFRIVDAGMYALLAWSLYRLLPTPKPKGANWLVVALIAFIPLEIYFSAGWLTTNVHYLWVTTLGVFSLVPLRKLEDGEAFRWYEYPLYLFALVYAASNEQLLVAVGLLYGLYFLSNALKKRFHPYVLLAGVVSAGGLVWALTSPGNAARKTAEIANWFPGFESLSLLKKLEMAFAGTSFQFFYNIDGVFLIFCLLLSALVWRKTAKWYERAVGSLPLAITLIFGFAFKGWKILAAVASRVGTSQFIHVLRRPAVDYGNALNTDYGMLIPAYLLVLLGGAAIVYSLFVVFQKRGTLAVMASVLGAGFLTRMLMALSPTLFASGLRTFLTLYCALIFADLLLFREMYLLPVKGPEKTLRYHIRKHRKKRRKRRQNRQHGQRK